MSTILHRCSLLALVLILVAPAIVLAQNGSHTSGLVIRADGRDLRLSDAELGKVARQQRQLGSAETGDLSVVSGVRLWDLLQLAGVPPTVASGRQRAVMYIKLTGADGQSAVLAMVEVDPSFASQPVLIADFRDGKKMDAAEGPWRVFTPHDQRHSRWIRGLTLIEVLTLK